MPPLVEYAPDWKKFTLLGKILPRGKNPGNFSLIFVQMGIAGGMEMW